MTLLLLAETDVIIIIDIWFIKNFISVVRRSLNEQAI